MPPGTLCGYLQVDFPQPMAAEGHAAPPLAGQVALGAVALECHLQDRSSSCSEGTVLHQMISNEDHCSTKPSSFPQLAMAEVVLATAVPSGILEVGGQAGGCRLA